MLKVELLHGLVVCFDHSNLCRTGVSQISFKTMQLAMTQKNYCHPSCAMQCTVKYYVFIEC